MTRTPVRLAENPEIKGLRRQTRISFLAGSLADLVRLGLFSIFCNARLIRASLTVLLAGFGVAFCSNAAAQTVMFSGSRITIGAGTDLPVDVAVDRDGNIYIVDQGNSRVLKETRSNGSYTQSTLGEGLSSPHAVAVDGNGNVYIADSGHGRTLKETLSNGTYTQSVIGSGMTQPYGVAVDASGNVYIADDLTMEVYAEKAQPDGSYIQSTIGSGLRTPTSVAVDSSGNVYIADSSASTVYKETLSPSGSYIQSIVASGQPFLLGVAVDSSGNVYLTNLGYSQVVKETPSTTGYTQSTVGIGLAQPEGVAVDDNGNLYIPDAVFQKIFKEPPSGAEFDAIDIGQTSATISAIFTFTAGGMIGAPQVLTQGAAGLDFADAGTGTCTMNHSYRTGDICTVDVTMTPRFAGTRYGAAEISDNSGNVLAVGYLRGIGIGPQVKFLPGIQSTISNVLAPSGIAVDAGGNVYVADDSYRALYKETFSSGSYTQTTVFYGSRSINGSLSNVAVDGSGNLYFTDSTEVYKETLTPSGGYVQSTIGSGLQSPFAITVDGSGNVYIDDYVTGTLYKETLAPSGTYTQSAIANGHVANGIAVDGSGNLYITDSGADSVLKETPSSSGSYTESTVVSGLPAPSGIAVDGVGNIYITDAVQGKVYMETPSSGSYVQTTVANGLTAPQGVAVDGRGNVFIADSTVLIEDLADAPKLSFASAAEGSTSGDSPQTVTVMNAGNAALAFPSPSTISYPNPPTGTNASISTSFTFGDSTTCPASSTGGTISANSACVYSINFVPAAIGGIVGAVTLTDNALNVTNARQAISLSGTGTPGPDSTSTVITINPSTLMAGQAADISATVADTTISISSPTGAAPPPTGAVTFSDQVGAVTTILNGGRSVQLSGGVATLTGVTLSGPATHTISATYAGVSGTYLASSGSTTVGVSADAPATASAPMATNFGSVAIKSSSSQTVTFTFTGAGIIGAPSVLTQGTPGLDFTDAGTGTCDTNGPSYFYNVGATCTVTVNFTPGYAGARFGAANIQDVEGNVLATAYLYGLGEGPQVNFLPGTQMTLPNTASGIRSPSAVAVDASGDLFIADLSNQVVKETLTNGSYTQSVVSIVPRDPEGIAVDGAGNVYIANLNGEGVVKETLSNGSYTQSVVAYVYGGAFGLTVDGGGNVYIADTSNKRVLKETLSNGGYIQSVIASASDGLSLPIGLTVDGGGSVYIADVDSVKVLKETLTNGGYTQSVVADSSNGLSAPIGVAVDAGGNVYIIDESKSEIMLETLSDGGYTQSMIEAGLNQPRAVAVDAGGNIYIADMGNNRVVKEDFADVPSLNFASTPEGSVSSDSPQTVTILNVGNQALTFPVPTTGVNASISSSFDFGGSSTCPEIGASGTAGSLSAGSACSYLLYFVPAAIGGISGSMVLTDNALNGTNVTQSIILSGTGIATSDATSTLVTINPAVLALGQTATVAATVKDTTNGSSTPVGTVSFTDTVGTVTNSLGTATLSGNTASLSGVLLGGIGPHTITATYEGVSGSYLSSSNSRQLVLSKAPATVTGPQSPPVTVIYGQTGSVVFNVSGPNTAIPTPTGAISYSILNASGASVASGTAPLATGSTGSTATVPILNSLAGGAYTIGVAYAGDDNYSSGSTATVALTVNQATPSIAWATPAAIAYGTALSSTQLNASSPIAGVFVYSPPAGTVLTEGSQILTVTFTPADSTDYASTKGTVQLMVSQALQAISFAPLPLSVTYGVSPIMLSATGGGSSNPVTFSIVSGPGSISGSTLTINGTGTVVVAANQLGDANYSAAAQVTQSMIVNPASQTVSFSTSTIPFAAGVSYGVAPLTLAATATSGLNVTFNLISGPATLSGNTLTITGAGTVVIAANQAGNSNYSSAAEVDEIITVNQAFASVAVSASTGTALAQNAVTLTAMVSSPLSTPTGFVTFLDGTTSLGTSSLVGGIATFTTSTLPIGSNSITAVYSGDANFLAATSSTLTEAVMDFSITTSKNSVIALPGSSVDILFNLNPSGGDTFPTEITLSVSGLPTGASYSFSPSGLAVGAGAIAVVLSVQLPQTSATAQPAAGLGRGIAPLFLALLLFPFAGGSRRPWFRRTLSVVLLLTAGIAAVTGINGCGSSNEVLSERQHTYTVTVNGTSGELSHSIAVNLTVE